MDARFEDAGEKPLRLRAESVEDLAVIAALLQDAAGQVGDFAWMRGRRRFALFLNRFRWEDLERAEKAGRPFERVRSVVMIENGESVRAQGVDPAEKEQSVSLLDLAFEPSEGEEDPSGRLRLILAGDGEVELAVECLDLRVEDVTRPYVAPSGRAPEHPAD